MNGKLVSYFGFAIRARKTVFGVDDIDTSKKGVFLIATDASLGESSKKTVQKARERLQCPLLVFQAGILGEYLHKPAVKAVAIKDKNLALAILREAEQEADCKIQQ